MGIADSYVAPQGRLNACRRQDFSYPNLWNDHPADVQSSVSEDRDETIKCVALGEDRTEGSKLGSTVGLFGSKADAK